MNEAMRAAPSIDQEITGETVEAHGYVVTPVARLRGRLGTMGDENSSGRFGWAAMRPLRVNVVDRNGGAQEVRIMDMQAQALTGMVGAGLFVAVVCVLISLVSRTGRR